MCILQCTAAIEPNQAMSENHWEYRSQRRSPSRPFRCTSRLHGGADATSNVVLGGRRGVYAVEVLVKGVVDTRRAVEVVEQLPGHSALRACSGFRSRAVDCAGYQYIHHSNTPLQHAW